MNWAGWKRLDGTALSFWLRLSSTLLFGPRVLRPFPGWTRGGRGSWQGARSCSPPRSGSLWPPGPLERHACLSPLMCDVPVNKHMGILPGDGPEPTPAHVQYVYLQKNPNMP